MSFWKNYTKIKDLETQSKVKNYLARIEPIVKEINFKDKDECYKIMERLEKFREQLKEKLYIFEVIEENEKLYIVIENNEELLAKIDKLILSDDSNIKKEALMEGHDLISKEEILGLFEMEKSMCKISYLTNDGYQVYGTGFFCKIDNFPIKYALFTNNHVLNESRIELGCTISFEYLEKPFFGSYRPVNKQITITENRNRFTNQELDYTCIELLESDGIENFFDIEPQVYSKDKISFLNNDIFVLQYPNGRNISFSYGKIKSFEDDYFKHDASTEGGSSGSPIVRKTNVKNIIGIHHSTLRENGKKINQGTLFDLILNNIEENNYQIRCIYIPNKKKINLIYDYSENLDIRGNEYISDFSEAKNLNLKLFQENVDLYVNDKKINFLFKYNVKNLNEIKVIFKFKKLLTNASHLFTGCSSIKSIDLSSFNTNNVKNMNFMFEGCTSLESIDLSSINTKNVKTMWGMFYQCSSLKSIDLSSFNTENVIDIGSMFYSCSSLKYLDLSTFKTINVTKMNHVFHDCKSLKTIDFSLFSTDNVTDMHEMFSDCTSLESIDLSSFHTNNVEKMDYMFYNCRSLKSIDLSSFNTEKVNNMSNMFAKCSSLISLDLSKFNTNKVKHMNRMFYFCTSLKSINISSFNTKSIVNFMFSGMSEMFFGCSSLKMENVIYNLKKKINN